MIKLLKLKNFRSIGEKELSLTLRPLTILVGPSGSGKSSILYFIDWLATKVTDPAIEGLVPQVKAIYGVTSFSDLFMHVNLKKKNWIGLYAFSSLEVRLPNWKIALKKLTGHFWGLKSPRLIPLGMRCVIRK
ncbi:AAA family ATPase [Dehalococcoidia bacterium]|nr:AAA family ATPase [Dehalococcoidia bacterium]